MRGFGDLGEVILAVGDYRKKLDWESEAVSNFVQDLREHVEQISSRRGKLLGQKYPIRNIRIPLSVDAPIPPMML